MKIGIVCYPSYGGSGVVATELAEALAERGHEVHIISYERPFRLRSFHQNLFLHEVTAVDYPVFKFPPYDLALAGTIYEVARTKGLDLVHAHYAIPHAVSAYLAKAMLAQERNLPLVTTLHGTDITVVGQEPQLYEVVRFSLQASDGVTAVSRALAEEAAGVFGYQQPIEVIYNFVDPEIYRRQFCPARRAFYARPDEKVLCHISNFREVKRIPDVLRIFALVNRQVPSRLLLIGDGPERSAAQYLAQELGVLERVHFLGKQEFVVPLLSISDLFLLPSAKESFGLAALEAMACEVPVVTTNTGGLPEVVTDGVTGIIEPVGAVEAMARRAIALLQNEEEHRRMAEAARQQALNRFREKEIVTCYENYYLGILRNTLSRGQS